MAKAGKVIVENINCPGKLTHVDAKKYTAMKQALMKVLPRKPPGLTQSEMFKAILPFLPDDLWPKGQKSGWWAKTVQLDLEAKRMIVRTDRRPLTWHRI